MGKLINTFSLFFLLHFGSFAQLRLESTPVYKNFGTVNGYLNNGQVYKTVFDPYGYLWIGTEGGLYRYNGKVFENIPIGSNDGVYNLDLVGKDLLLVLRHNGKTKGIHLRTRKLMNTDSLFGLNKLIQNGRPYALSFKRGDTIIIIKKNYLDSINKIPSMVMIVGNNARVPKNRNEAMHWAAQFIFHTPYDVETEHIMDHWIHTYSFFNKKNNILVFNKSIYYKWHKDSSYKVIFDGNNTNPQNIISCALLKDKELFVGHLNGGLIRYNNYVDSGIKSSSTILFKEQLITDIIEDEHKNIWVSSYGNGIFKLNNEELNTFHYNKENSGISSNEVLMLQKIDEQNAISFTAANSTLDFYSPTNHKKDSISFWLQGIFALGKNAFLMHDKGIYKLAYSSEKGMGQKKRFINTGEQSMAWKETVKWGNKYYCLSLLSIYAFDSLGNYTVKSIYPIKSAMSLLPISDSDFLIGTTSGIYRNDKKLNWLQNANFNKILRQGNEIIICTRDGIYCIDIHDLNNQKALHKINEEVAYNAYLNEDLFYFQTKTGILILDKKTKKVIKNVSFLNYTIPFSINDFFLDKDYIAVAGNKGIFYIPQKDFLKKKTAPKIYILNSLNNYIPADSVFQCKFNKNLVAFFDLDILDNGNDIKHLKYRILKDDNDFFAWTTVKESPLIRLNKPEPGIYTIEYLIIANEWKKSLKYKLIIRAFWWQTIWFKAILALLLITLLGLFLNKYIRRLHFKKTKKLLMELKIIDLEARALAAQFNPHFIFNAMIPIQNMALKNDTMGTLKYLNKFSNLMRTILDKSRQNATPLNVEIKFLEDYLEVQKSVHNYKFSFDIISSEEIVLSNTFIPSMLIQPLIENAVEHGVANLSYPGKITIEFSSKGKLLFIKISDNGAGFSKTTMVKEGHAIKILIDRLYLIKKIYGVGEIIFYDNENKNGGVSKLTLPLINNTEEV